MRRISTTTRAWCLLFAYATLILARVAHAASPAPAHDAPAPHFPTISADCGPCDDPAHHHEHRSAHEDHCPVCNAFRPGADATALLGAAACHADDACVGFVDDPRATQRCSAVARHAARAPPVR